MKRPDEKIRILLVDDEPNVLRAISRLFMDDDYEMLTAASGQEGLKMLEGEPVQIVISGYRMPMMDGVEFLKQVRNMHPQATRIVMSGYADTGAIVSAINEGEIYKFIPKPWDDNELKVAVRNALERYFLARENMELALDLKKKNEELSRVNEELKKLLAEKSDRLEFEGQIAAVFRDVVDTVPLGILGVDPDDMVVLCNSAWQALAGQDFCVVGEKVEGELPANVAGVIKVLKEKESGKVTVRTRINGTNGTLVGSAMRGSGRNGIILAFIPDSCMGPDNTEQHGDR
ncbi:MAG: response regulator [Nitrospiraceae bacterium]|nr:response regulator [Nitrospiraceae bacterium]